MSELNKYTELTETISTLKGYAFKSAEYVNSGIPVVRVSDFTDNSISLSELVFYPVEKASQYSKYKLKVEDVLIQTVGSWPSNPASVVGKVIKVPFELDGALLNQNIVKIIPKRIINAKYLYYQLKSDTFKNYIINCAQGAASQASITLEAIKKYKFELPNLLIQDRIASILSTYDELIENNNRRIAILEQTAEQIYKEWFVRMRFPGYENTEFEKGVPKNWEIVPLGSISNILMGQSPKSEYYNQDGVGLPFHQGVGSYGKRIPKHETFCSVKGRLAQQNDILFSVRAPVGRINNADTKLIIGRGLASLRHKKGLQSYLFYLLNYYFQLEDIIGNGSIFNSVGKEELNKFKILQPNNELDKKFNDFIVPIDSQLNNLLCQNQNLKQTRDLLLPRLISGKLKVKEAEKEME